ncbi:MAG: hypothetical protein IPM39_07605 [Chloroflexi bacterium]|nr:hypothetical protein [Chloroflexota bacterium]
MKHNSWALLGFVLMLMVTALACALPGSGPSAPAPTPTPLGDSITFTIPAYAANLAPGDGVPGTGLKFIDRQVDAYQVSIDGQTALKRAGDSFFWSGVLAPGVFANFNLRLTASVFGSLPVAGLVELIVLNPQPVEELGIPANSGTYRYSHVVADYTIPVGYQVPGTTAVFTGVEERGQGSQTARFARMSGMSGYPYLALGDSFVWTGRIRDNVHLAYNLRVTTLNEQNLRLTGTAELWVDAPR